MKFKSIQPYVSLIRLNKPAGTHLLFIPCTWSLTMAAYAYPSISLLDYSYQLGLFGVGALIMRGAGCTINDLWDRKMDRLVERTKSRPLASGVLSPFQAISFLGLQLSLGLGILTQLNLYSIALGIASMPLVILYPFMKRITFWPQAILGFTFNWGALLGWSALVGYSDWAVTLPLYLGGVFWTLSYDTIYALQDKSDDIKAGVKSTALRFGTHIHSWLILFGIGSISCLGIAGWMNHQSWIYFSSLAGFTFHLLYQISQVNLFNVKNAGHLFASNVHAGYLLSMGLVADLLYKRYKEKSSKAPLKEFENNL